MGLVKSHKLLEAITRRLDHDVVKDISSYRYIASVRRAFYEQLSINAEILNFTLRLANEVDDLKDEIQKLKGDIHL